MIRQFVAAPLGAGITAEEQLTGAAEHGGIQIVVHPMKKDWYDRLFAPRVVEPASVDLASVYDSPYPCAAPMGSAAGGLMRQEIYNDTYDFDVWDTSVSSRCFVTILNAESWQAVTGKPPPSRPITAEVYARLGVPWFDYYAAGSSALPGSTELSNLKSIKHFTEFGLPEKIWKPEPVAPTPPIDLGPNVRPRGGTRQVREAEF